MSKISFNELWKVYPVNEENSARFVTLPDDALLYDVKKADSPSNVNNGWYEARDYEYVKTFKLTEEQRGKKLILEFEGVYQKASIYINDKKVGYHSYGYTGFYVDITNAVEQEKENILKVIAVNSDQPNCRWYSGTGIYRPVWLYVLENNHIELEGVQITPCSLNPPTINLKVKTTGVGDMKIEILDGDKVLTKREEEVSHEYQGLFELPDVELWTAENPKLYSCQITYAGSVTEESFGIRMIELSTKDGLLINGERVVLKGACVHHDNGLLGACAYDFAEYRKVKLLKENGFNAIRSSHNPCSKAMLRACDELGMYLLDEYADMWYVHKTKYDYAEELEENYHADLADIVRKDYNHPSVIMYSTGNEVGESGEERGVNLCRQMTETLHSLDTTRPVTCGINIFFNFLSSLGLGVYSEKKAEAAIEKSKKKKAVGSEFYNQLAGVFGAEFMKFGATLPPCDTKTKEAYANMDIAGYNYGINRYLKDLKKYPNRFILGSETFCNDAYKFWEIAKKNKRVIGDFVWAGIDYLGEVGVGAWEYKEYAPDFAHGVGWISAGSGRIDLTGKPLTEMEYMQVAFEEKQIAVGVVPVHQDGQAHSASAWKMTNAMSSWSWNGCEGKKARVEVYARANEVEIKVNGCSKGRKKVTKDCRVNFCIPYEPGELQVYAYDTKNKIIAFQTLQSAGEKTVLKLEPELEQVRQNRDLCYLRIRLCDENGILKPMERSKLSIMVKNAEVLGFGTGCPYQEKPFYTPESDTYYGEALAILRPTSNENMSVSVDSRYGKAEKVIEVV